MATELYNLGLPVHRSNPLPVDPGPITITRNAISPSAPAGSLTLATAATAQDLFLAQEAVNGAVIENPLQADSTGQNIAAAESIWYDATGALAVMQAGGTSMELKAGQTVSLPCPSTKRISWIAATVNHRIAAYKW